MIILIPYILSVVVVVNFILSVIILSRGLKNRTNELFGFLSAGVALWSFAILGFYFFETSLYWKRLWIVLSHSSAAFIAVVFVYFSSNFPYSLIRNKYVAFLPTLPFLLVLYYLFYTPQIVGNVFDTAYEINPHYIFYALYMVFYFSTTYIFLFLQYKKSKNLVEKTQVEFIIAGLIPASILATITDLIFPFFGIFQYTWLGPVFTLILVVSIAIAIFKYHIFSIKVITTELVTFAVWILLLGRLLFAKTWQQMAIDGILLLLVVFFGILLMRSVLKEVRTREEMERLTGKLKTANIRLKKLDEAKSEFISIASHQLRTPLTSIKGYSSMLLEGSFGKMPEAAKLPLERICQSSKGLVELVGEFLNLSRIERGKMEYKFEKIDLKKIITDITGEFETINHKNLDIKFKANKKESFIINGDQNKIRQVASNLIDNAMKYTEKGFIKIYLHKNPERETITLKVRDSGIGMSKETIARIFVKFSRAREGISEIHTEGLGIGLYIAKEIIKAHGGEIWSESNGEGKGSTFYAELPTNFIPS